MWKYIKTIFTAGWSILFTAPRARYYARHTDKVPYEKRATLASKLYRKVSEAFHVKYKIEGYEKVPSGPVLFISNHQSFMDPFMYYLFNNRPIIYVAKKQIAKFPFAGHVSTSLESIYIDREDIRAALDVVKSAAQVIKSGKSVWLFPEGTRTRNVGHTMNEFKPGGFKIAYLSKATIVPCALSGSWRILNKNIKQKEYPVDIQFFDPITYDEYKDLSTVELSNKVHDIINDKVMEFLKITDDINDVNI